MENKVSKALLVALSLVMYFAETTWSAPIINVGTHNLAPNEANQVILVNVTGTDMVAGFNLKAQIGAGLTPGDQPIFQSIDFSGGMWDAYSFTTIGDGPIPGHEQLADFSVMFNGISDKIAANGLVVTMLIDTRGFVSGNFPLMFASTEHGIDSDFLDPDGASISADITNGTIHITPEPVTMSLLGLGGLTLLRRKRITNGGGIRT